MSNIAIAVESLSKSYLIGHNAAKAERYTSLRDVVARNVRSVARKTGDMFSGRAIVHGDEVEEFCALQDVSFEIKQGDRVGIIGRNGAGKSTLLKILSRITEPTKGRVQMRGRVASLLEVGTGFHPELTGRENIFLNGAILGMSRSDIQLKFDEIVAFAEVEKFLDTPVKRYSSGMYVRLAFAVAAHLEPEILIVDEVLAVGDTEFQKKCLGKMQEVSEGGRTVLFVSHNMAAVSSLTSRGLVLSHGRMVFNGTSAAAIEHYVQLGNRASGTKSLLGRGSHTAILGARLLDESGNAVRHYTPGSALRLEVSLETDGAAGLSLEAFLLDATRQKLALASLHQFHGITLPDKPGRYCTVLDLSPLWLASGSYSFDLTTSLVNSNWDHYVEDALDFDVHASNPGQQSWDFKHSLGYGAFAMPCLRPPEFRAS